MKAWNYLQKTGSSINTKIIKQTRKIMVDVKDVLVGEYRKSPVFAGYYIFAYADQIERYIEDAIFRFHETKKDDQIMAATNLFGNIINIHPFEDRNGRICCLILAHVLIQTKFCLFSVILNSSETLHRGSKEMPRKSINVVHIDCCVFDAGWDNFEQNAKMLSVVDASFYV